MTSFDASQEPPSKRPRFFKDQPPPHTRSAELRSRRGSSSPQEETLIKGEDSKSAASLDLPKKTEISSPPNAEQSSDAAAVVFDAALFESVIGDKLSPDTLAVIRDNCGNDLERAVNLYLDGTYKKLKPAVKQSPGSTPSTARQPPTSSLAAPSPPATAATAATATATPVTVSGTQSRARYVGAFGVEGWATRSGSNIIKHGDVVKIERQKIQPPQWNKAKAKAGTVATTTRPNLAASRRVDVIVRFTNQSGVEIGRLAKEAADWVSTLMDQNMCSFQGTCVYAPDRLRTNDTVFLQLRCFLLNTAFERRGFELADDRSTTFYEQSETKDERELRLRQVALVKLLHEVNLQPTKTNAASRDGRKSLLEAAEMDEQKQKEAKKAAASKGSSSPPASSDAEDGQELEQDQLDALYKKAQCFDFQTPEAEPAESFAMTLRPYQKQSLHWMMAKEKDQTGSREPSMHPLWEEYTWPVKDADDKELPQTDAPSKFYVNPYSGDLSLEFPAQEQHCLGGVLADEMGLGKTIQMLSLVHSHRSEEARKSRMAGGNGSISSVNQLPRLGSNSASVLWAPCTTLVVAPMSLLAQWQSEAEKASRAGTMKIELYYGPEKTSNLQALCCGGGGGGSSTAPDLVITSYGIVLSEFSSIAAKKGDRAFHNGLFSLNFFRVILDEAHHIKNRASKTARACYELAARHRWVLTGTPIVNKLEDLFSLVRFLGVEPWNNFSFWKTFITVPFEAGDFVRALDVVQTVLEPLVMRRTKEMKTPSGEPLVALPPKHVEIVSVELSRPEREIYDYIFQRAKRTFSHSVETGNVMKAYTTIFAQILRLRQSCCHPILVRNRDLVADEAEAGAAADAVAGLADDMDLEVLVSRFTAASAAAAAGDGDGDDEGPSAAFGAKALAEIRDGTERECPLCFEDPPRDPLVTGCWHSACKTCLLEFMQHESERGVVPRYFNCREVLNRRDLFEVVRHDDDDDFDDDDNDTDHIDNNKDSDKDDDKSVEQEKPTKKEARITLHRLNTPSSSSAKISTLLTHLRTLRSNPAHRPFKAVVFSQFTSFLDLLQPALTTSRIIPHPQTSILRLDGAMPQRARAACLADFASRKGPLVLLISLRAGGVGLNLTSASYVFLMDPWWSFAVEAQAIDRVHRLGQEREVVVKRFIVRESVEERMLRIQERKKFIATSLGMMSDEEKKLQRIEDIKELLS